jgi:ABC-type protease/lipase transport system fused ATPase/permease subunit
VTAEEAMAARPPAAGVGTRLVGAVLIVAMAIGSLALWIAVPLGCLWVSSKVVGSSSEEYLLGLPMTIAAMILFGMALVWLNRLYLRVTGVLARYEAEQEEFGVAPHSLRGPLEPLLVGSLVIALVAMFVWFFLLARNPPLVPL